MKIVEGFLLGLSTGTSCIMACYPIFLPYLFSKLEGLKNNNIKFLFFTAGRFISYIIVGIILGLAGYFALKYIPAEFEVYLRRISWIIAGILLIINGINLEFSKSKFCLKTRFISNNKISSFFLGFLAGLNLCPPFLAAASRVFGLPKGSPFISMINGGLYFMIFFLGTTIFLIPLMLVGLIKKKKDADQHNSFNFINISQFIARWTMIILGIYFSFFEGILYFISRIKI